MQNNFVADTMALVLRLEKRKLPQKITQIFNNAENNSAEIYIPAIVLAEIAYLSEKRKIEINLSVVKDYSKIYKSIIIKDMSFISIESSFRIKDIPELHDRLIAGTGLELNMAIMTNDPKILNSKYVKAFWE